MTSVCKRIDSDVLVEYINSEKRSGNILFDLECLFLSSNGTRPSMRYTIYRSDLERPDWPRIVSERIAEAVLAADDGERVVFEVAD